MEAIHKEPGNILIIDDERVICDGCRLALSDKGHSVDICMTGRDGLEMTLNGTYDLALLDMKLPDMDGMDILRTIRSKTPNVYVIVMTGYSSVQNAVEAMTDGGRVLIKTEILNSPLSDASADTQRPGRHIKCIVADDGPGIPEELRQSIFEPHVSSKPNHSGLGLAVVRDLAEKLNGSIECDSQPDVGTCFTVLLPLAEH